MLAAERVSRFCSQWPMDRLVACTTGTCAESARAASIPSESRSEAHAISAAPARWQYAAVRGRTAPRLASITTVGGVPGTSSQVVRVAVRTTGTPRSAHAATSLDPSLPDAPTMPMRRVSARTGGSLFEHVVDQLVQGVERA